MSAGDCIKRIVEEIAKSTATSPEGVVVLLNEERGGPWNAYQRRIVEAALLVLNQDEGLGALVSQDGDRELAKYLGEHAGDIAAEITRKAELDGAAKPNIDRASVLKIFGKLDTTSPAIPAVRKAHTLWRWKALNGQLRSTTSPT